MKVFLAVLMVLSLLLGVGAANAAELANPSKPLPQPTGAKHFYSQNDLQQALRFRVFVQKADGTIEAALDPARIDYLEAASGAGSAGPGGPGDAAASGAGCR